MVEGENKENKGEKKISYRQTKLHHLSCQAPKKFQ